MSLPIRVSVTELVSRAGSGGIGLAVPGADERMALGTLLHRLHQADCHAAGGDYASEVPLSALVTHAGRAVRIEGRADGLRRDKDGTRVVEELKSGAGARARGGESLTHERLQASLYAWMLAREAPGPVGAELVWLATDACAGVRVTSRETLALDLARVEAELHALLAGVVADAARREALAARRAALAGALAFPFAVPRAGQSEISRAVEAALAEQRHLLLEAPTGTGKTIAVLLPALRHAFGSGGRVFMLTSRGAQQRGVLAALERIAPPGSAAAALVRPKLELCATGTLLCHEDECAFAHGFGRKLADGDLLGSLLERDTVLRPSAALALGRAAEACPHALARAAAREAALTVADFNHVFDPAVALPEIRSGEALAGAVLLVDEAHQLAERARDARSAELARGALLALAETAAAGGAPAHGTVREAARALAAGIDALARDAIGGDAEGDGEIEWELPRAALAEELLGLERAAARYLEYRLETRTLAAGDAILEGARRAHAFGAALAAAGPGYATSIAWQRGEPRLRVLCLEPERELGALFARCRSVIAFSATLQPFTMRRALLGLAEERTDALAVPSPFERARRAVVIEKRADTRLRARQREAPRLAKKLAAFAAAVPGHVLALAPSFAWIEALRARLALPGHLVLAQQSGDDGDARERLIAALAGPRAPRVLLLAVAGGILGEGVEWPGALGGVAVLGPCLPPPDLVRELLRRRFEERFGDGFALAYALPGMTRVIQGAGRLIRSAEDRGVVALYDRRFLEEPWRSLLPSEWLEGGAAENLVGDPARVARAFFAGG